MAHLVETMVSAQGQVPWHGLGTVIEDPGMNSADALRLAELDWKVEKLPANEWSDDHVIFPDDMYFNVRDIDGSVLGVVGKNYSVLDNVDAFQFGDDLLDASGAHWITAGSLKHGRSVWMMAELPDDIIVGGMDSEKIKPYMLISNSHDGSSAITAALTMVRVVCNNTLTWGLKEAKRTFKVRHTRTAGARFAEVRRALDLSYNYMDEFNRQADRLLNTEYDVNEFINQLLPMPPVDSKQIVVTKMVNRRDQFRSVYYDTEDLDNIRGTAWGMLQATAALNDHHTKGRGDNQAEKRFNRIMGAQPNLTKKALQILAPA